MADRATPGYTVDDLDRLGDEIGLAHLSAGSIEFDVGGRPVRLELP